MGVIDDATELVGLIKKVGDADLYRRIVKLEGEVIELTRSNRNSEEKIVEMERALKFSKELTFKAPFYWLDGDNNPYCAGCWDSKHLAIHVTDSWDPVRYSHKECPACKHHYAARAGI
jgi:hypothetical protein